jgi:transposase
MRVSNRRGDRDPHVKAALSAMTMKTDKNGARGIAQLMRLGWFRPVHVKTPLAQEVRALLTARKLLVEKQRDVRNSLRGILRGFGLKVGQVGKAGFADRIRDLVAGQTMLEAIVEPLLQVRGTLREQHAILHRRLLRLVRDDAVCQPLMTASLAPSADVVSARSAKGVGPVVAMTFKTAVDDPGRFARSKAVGAYFGLVPRKYQSGEIDRTGRITKVGDAMMRTALFEAANVMLSRTVRFSALKAWAMRIAARHGMKKAKVALARKLAVVLHRMWVDGSAFRWSNGTEAATVA